MSRHAIMRTVHIRFLTQKDSNNLTILGHSRKKHVSQVEVKEERNATERNTIRENYISPWGT